MATVDGAHLRSKTGFVLIANVSFDYVSRFWLENVRNSMPDETRQDAKDGFSRYHVSNLFGLGFFCPFDQVSELSHCRYSLQLCQDGLAHSCRY